MFMPASGLGSVGAGMEEILSSSASICREISSAPFALFLIRTPGPPPFSAMNSTHLDGGLDRVNGAFLQGFAALKPNDCARGDLRSLRQFANFHF
jgi:hypothetical protein